MILLLELSAYACTAFCTARGDSVLVGNNEDFVNPFTKVWYEPAANDKYGKVYFGFDNFNPQGGMNEKGLVFDYFATAPRKVEKSCNKPKFGGNLMDEVMSQCATVDEALRLLDKHNLEYMERFMTFIADDQGHSAIIEGDEVIRKSGEYQIITNFYQSDVNDGNAVCPRYAIANAILKDANEVSVDLCKRVLAATQAEGQGATLYSNVYDVKQRVVYLYHFHNFQNEVKIDLAQELQKGKRQLDLPALFPRTFAAELFQNAKAEELQARKAQYTHKVSPEILETYVGRYQLPLDEAEPVVITITRENDKLFTQMSGAPSELCAVSDSEFVYVSLSAGANLKFVKDSNGKTTGFVAQMYGVTYTAQRIE
jgi:hypothetical protein